MSIIQSMCTSFKSEILSGVHDFTSHTFKIALYGADAVLGPESTAYTASGEASGTSYTAGGKDLTVVDSSVSTAGATAFVDFADVSWDDATITARGALIYNSTVSGNPAVIVLDFGMNKTVASAPFTVYFPVSDASSAIVRVS